MSITFTKRTTTVDAATEEVTYTDDTVIGEATIVRGDLKRYEALGLRPTHARTLLFAAQTYGDEVEIGSTVEVLGVTYTVRDIEMVAPDGFAIITRVIVER